MSLNIKDPKAEAIVRRLAGVKGQTITKAIEESASKELALVEGTAQSAKAKRILAIAQRVWAMPVVDDRSIEDMLYDENGLPK